MKETAILIVDDKKENILSLEEILEDINVRIVSSSSGNDAVARCLESEFALILMDVQMPGMNGFEAIKLIRKDSKNMETPVIFLSAIYSDDYHKIKGIQEGAVDFISKPIVEEILIGKVKIFLQMYNQKKTLQDQMKEIESLNRDMNHFNRILIHDLKQPLSGIMGLSEYIFKINHSVKLPDEIRDMIGHIYKSGVNMHHIITDVIDLIQVKNENSEMEEINFSTLLDEIMEIYKDYEKKIKFELPEFPALKGKKPLLRSIFRNLISNSVKYNENNEINISISYKNQNGSHCFYIKDNGIGIPEDKIDEIFLPFKRAVEGTKYEGTGIGLSIVSSAVEKLRGNISVEKTGKMGSTIRIEIPAEIQD
ncbi:MAG: hybrid sensor histidine kinase/response regulator, partial [Spirochaetia bacterium]|nr:hybrid sensor histidine kinase/response regulator [Spirochaetia bacterium]